MRFVVYTENQIDGLIKRLGYRDPIEGYYALFVNLFNQGGEYGVIELNTWYKHVDRVNDAWMPAKAHGTLQDFLDQLLIYKSQGHRMWINDGPIKPYTVKDI